MPELAEVRKSAWRATRGAKARLVEKIDHELPRESVSFGSVRRVLCG